MSFYVLLILLLLQVNKLFYVYQWDKIQKPKLICVIVFCIYLIFIQCITKSDTVIYIMGAELLNYLLQLNPSWNCMFIFIALQLLLPKTLLKSIVIQYLTIEKHISARADFVFLLTTFIPLSKAFVPSLPTVNRKIIDWNQEKHNAQST